MYDAHVMSACVTHCGGSEYAFWFQQLSLSLSGPQCNEVLECLSTAAHSPNPGLQAQSVGATAFMPANGGGDIVMVIELMPLGHVLHSAMEPPGLYVPLVQGKQKAPPNPG
jgi:hypothetical protein